MEILQSCTKQSIWCIIPCFPNTYMLGPRFCLYISIYWWLSAGLKYRQCVSNGETAVCHKTINMMHNSLFPQYLHVGTTFLLIYIYIYIDGLVQDWSISSALKMGTLQYSTKNINMRHKSLLPHTYMFRPPFCLYISIYRWLSEGLMYLLCLSNEETAVLHKAINMMHNSLFPEYLHVGTTS